MPSLLILFAAVLGISILFVPLLIRSVIRSVHITGAPTLWQCFVLFLILSGAQVPVLVILAFQTGAGWGHSARANAQFPFVCLLSFLLGVVCPTAGLLLCRHWCLQGPTRRRRLIPASAATVLAMVAATAFCIGRLGTWPPLVFAANHGAHRLAHLLLTLGASTSTVDCYNLWTPLTSAVWNADFRMVEVLLQHRTDVNQHDGTSQTALTTAAIRDDATMVKFLLDRGADPTISDGAGWTPMMHAIRKGDRVLFQTLASRCFSPEGPLDAALREAAEREDDSRVQTLLERMVKRNVWSSLQKGETLLKAAQSGSLDALQEALEIGADIGFRGPANETALMLASIHGEPKQVAFLLDRGALIDAQNRDGDTALMSASSLGRTEVVRLLLQKGAVVELTNRLELTALMQGAAAGRAEAVKSLIAAGALLERRDGGGKTALIWACAGQHQDTARVLLDAGADPNAFDSKEITALTQATVNGHPQIEKLLLEHGAKRDAGRGLMGGLLRLGGLESQSQLAATQLEKEPPGTERDLYAAINRADTEKVVRLLRSGAAINARSARNASTPLIWAVWCGKIQMVKLLLERGADVNGTSEFDVNPLMEAAKGGHLEIARLLLARGADVQARSKKGWTALMWASECGDETMVRLLLENRADTGARTIQGQTALQIANAKGHSRVVELLQHSQR